MTGRTGAPPLRPPVLFGCTAAIAAVVVVVLAVVFALLFLGGSATGSVVLSTASSYAKGTVVYNGQHNFYLVRLPQGTFLALSDVVTEGSADHAPRCRVRPVATDDPTLPGLLQQYSSQMSPQAASTTFLFRDACQGSVFDITGLRLDGTGLNLDRYPITVNSADKLVVDTRSPQCTQRQGNDLFASVACPLPG